MTHLLFQEAVTERTRRTRTRSILEKIVEEEEPDQGMPQVQVDQLVAEANVIDPNFAEAQNVTLPHLSEIEPPNVAAVQPEDIADMLTQKIQVLSQTGKRTSAYEISVSFFVDEKDDSGGNIWDWSARKFNDITFNK